MSCLGPKYNPIPTRAWVRFQNECSEPFAPRISPEVMLRLQMNNKGNIGISCHLNQDWQTIFHDLDQAGNRICQKCQHLLTLDIF